MIIESIENGQNQKDKEAEIECDGILEHSKDEIIEKEVENGPNSKEKQAEIQRDDIVENEQKENEKEVEIQNEEEMDVDIEREQILNHKNDEIQDNESTESPDLSNAKNGMPPIQDQHSPFFQRANLDQIESEKEEKEKKEKKEEREKKEKKEENEKEEEYVSPFQSRPISESEHDEMDIDEALSERMENVAVSPVPNKENNNIPPEIPEKDRFQETQNQQAQKVNVCRKLYNFLLFYILAQNDKIQIEKPEITQTSMPN